MGLAAFAVNRRDLGGLMQCSKNNRYSITSSARQGPLLSWRDEGFPFFNDINCIQFDRLISCAFIVNCAVRKRYRLTRAQDLFRLAVQVQPEVDLYDMSHYHARMTMAPCLETRGDLYCGVDDLQISSGHVRSLQDRALDRRGLDWRRLRLCVDGKRHSECD